MNTEHDLARSRIAPRAPAPDDDLAPGRGTRSSQLTAPSHPIAGGLIQRKARDANGVASAADAVVASAASSSGSSLPAPIMRKFEASLGADLSGVRVHTSNASAEAAHAVGARAYTIGQDIHFGAGQYVPSSEGGQHLLAHEVAHTVQQRGSAASRQNKLEVSSPGDAAEREADSAALAMVTGAPFAISSHSGVLSRAPSESQAGESESKSEGKGENKSELKFPSYEGKEKVLTLPLGTGEVKLNMGEHPSAHVGWKQKAEAKLLKLEKTWPTPLLPGLSLDVALDAKAGLAATLAEKLDIGWEEAPPPWVEGTQQLKVSGFIGGKVGLDLEGGVKFGLNGGLPGTGIAAGGRLALEAVSEIGAQLGIEAGASPAGDWHGQFQLIVTGDVALNAKGSLYIDAVLLGDRTSLYTYELFDFPLAQAKIVCKAPIDLATGKPINEKPEITFQLCKLPTPKQVAQRPAPGKLPVNQGASGSTSDMPTEDDTGAGGAGGQ